jgi:hypothetical protein
VSSDGKSNLPISLKEGDSKDLYPNPRDRKVFLIVGIACIVLSPVPFLLKNNTKSGSPGLAPFVLLLVGAFLIYSVFYTKQRDKYEELLFKTGECFFADITDCIVHRNYYHKSKNYSNSYTLVCQYRDGKGTMQECKRYALGYDPRPYINSGKVKVYVDQTKPANPNNYVIDVKGSMDSLPDNY